MTIKIMQQMFTKWQFRLHSSILNQRFQCFIVVSLKRHSSRRLYRSSVIAELYGSRQCPYSRSCFTWLRARVYPVACSQITDKVNVWSITMQRNVAAACVRNQSELQAKGGKDRNSRHEWLAEWNQCCISENLSLVQRAISSSSQVKRDRRLWGRKCFLAGFNCNLGSYLNAVSSVFIEVCLDAFSCSSLISTSSCEKQNLLRKAFNITLRRSHMGSSSIFVLTFLYLSWQL